MTTLHAGTACDRCGTYDRVPESIYCAACQADGSGPPELDMAGMIRTLEAAGYTVRKARARKAYSAAGYDVRTCVHCGTTATRTTKVGARKPKDRLEVGVCEDCYRFGPHLHGVPRVPADPARYARLVKAWRHAQHRYAGTIRHDYRGAYNAHARLLAITKALNAARFVGADYYADKAHEERVA